MKIVILGAGVIGVTSAWFLLKKGHEVTIIDKHTLASCETSYANAGLLAPSDAFAWAKPSAPWFFLKSILNKNSGIKLVPSFNLSLIKWSFQFILQCTNKKYIRNTKIKYEIAKFSLKCLDEIIDETAIEFHQDKRGIFYFFENVRSMQQARKSFSLLADFGLEISILDRQQLIKKMDKSHSLPENVVGAVFSKNCRTGDCRLFTRKLLEKCKQLNGFKFINNEEISKIINIDNKISSVVTDANTYRTDSVVVAMGCSSMKLLSSVGVNVSILPTRGFSATIETTDNGNMIKAGFEDSSSFMALNMLGNNLRISCGAEFTANQTPSTSMRKSTKKMLRGAAKFFPNVKKTDNIEITEGFRPMTPSTVPIIGQSSIENLFINTGHGHLGWTMSCGSAKIISEIISGNKQQLPKNINSIHQQLIGIYPCLLPI